MVGSSSGRLRQDCQVFETSLDYGGRVLKRMGVGVAMGIVIPVWEFFVLIWMSDEHPLSQFTRTGLDDRKLASTGRAEVGVFYIFFLPCSHHLEFPF